VASQFASLLLILDHLDCNERVAELGPLAHAFSRDLMGFDQAGRAYFGNALGPKKERAAIDPAELTTDRVAVLVDDLIAETRDVIVRRDPAAPAEPASNDQG
jgi:hypothetical protein